MKKLTVASLGALAVGYAPGALGQTPDMSISGIRPGMTLAQVKALLPPGFKAQIDPTFAHQTSEGMDASEVVLMAQKTMPSERGNNVLTDTETYDIEFFQGRAFYIRHFAEYSQAQGDHNINAPLATTFEQVAGQKYGFKFTHKGISGLDGQAYAYYAPDGRAVLSSADTRPSQIVMAMNCAGESNRYSVGGASWFGIISPLAYANGFIRVASEPRPSGNDACYGLGVYAAASYTKFPEGVLMRFTQTLIDYRPLQAFARAAGQHAAQGAQDANRAAQGRTPNL